MIGLTQIEELFPTKEENVLETVEQQCLVLWLEKSGLKFSAIPNSTYTKSWKQKEKNHREGVRSGLPDLVVVIPKELSQEKRPLMLWVEMKRQTGGSVQKNQKEWIRVLNTVNEMEARVCKGATEAVAFIREYTNF